MALWEIKEKEELSIIMNYLPDQLSEVEIENIVKEGIIETKADSSKDIGEVMSWIMPKIKGKADGKTVSAKVNTLLNA